MLMGGYADDLFYSNILEEHVQTGTRSSILPVTIPKYNVPRDNVFKNRS